jgi:hypothetical protein
MQWDEYPFASGRFNNNPRPQVMKVPESQNRAQGGIIAAAYRVQNIKVGDSYFVAVIP